MSLPIMNAKPEDLNTVEKCGKYTVCIVGCGQVGLHHAALFAEAGFKVVCFDADQIVVNNVARGRTPFSQSETEAKIKEQVRKGRLTATSDIKKAVSPSDIIVFTIPVRTDGRKKPDYSNVEGVCKRIGSSLRLGSLVIFVKLAGIGIVEGTVKEALENSSGFRVGTDFGLAYSPFHGLSSQGQATTADRPRLVAATEGKSLNAASAVLALVSRGGLEKTANMKAAGAASLFQIQQKDVAVALANELALFCEKIGVDYFEANELLAGSVSSLLEPPVFSNENIQEEPYLLLADAENQNVKLRIPAIAREINEQIAKHVANLVKDALRSCGKTLRRSRVSLLGLSQMPNTRSHPKRIVKQIVQILTARGARIRLYDPYFSENELGDLKPLFKKNLTEALEAADCIVILTGHDQFKRLGLNKLKVMMKKPSAIVDLERVVEPAKAEKEGFIYRGLGRGVWTK
ncbi:MAG: nucleotide sugar dehydrogenase [Candidatus Bathyarchaeia archaeon]|jgi:nucleotide sugar dehydrogenase